MSLTQREHYLLEDICLFPGCHNASDIGMTCNEHADRNEPDGPAPEASIELKDRLEAAGERIHLGREVSFYELTKLDNGEY